MSRFLLLITLMLSSLFLDGQNISVTFTGRGAATQIDNVIATNLTKNQSVILPGDETLILTVKTGIPSVSEIVNFGIVYPNPFSGSATCIVAVQKPQTIVLNVQNLVGKVVAQTKTLVQQGGNEFMLSVNTIGIYLVSLTTNQGTESYKVICTHASESENRIQFKGRVTNDEKKTLQKGLEVSQTEYALEYTLGDIIHYKCKSGIYTTLLTDSPTNSKNYDVEFVVCMDPDGKNYSIVKIGSQTWMAENLAYLPIVSPSSDGSKSSPYYYIYGYEGSSINAAKATTNYTTYGVLYNWEAARTVCPHGWHLSTDAEWTILTDYLTKSGSIGKALKFTSGWSESGNGDNSSAFAALPGGYRSSNLNDPGFSLVGVKASFWSSSEFNMSYAWYRFLDNSSNMYTHTSDRGSGFSVRCLQNY